jgi:hypothetical protein
VKKLLLPLLLAFLFLIAGIFTLPDYGINWDSPLHYLRGQAYADIYLNKKTTLENTAETSPAIVLPYTFASRYYFAAIESKTNQMVNLSARPLPQKEFMDVTDLLNKRLSFYSHHADNGDVFKYNDGAGHLPLVDTLSAFSNRFFYGLLGLIGDIDSYQIIYLALSAIGIFVVTIFAFEISGSTIAGVTAGLFLALWPLFFGEAHINPKDPIQASFFAGALWSFWHWVKSNNLGWFCVFGAFVGVALAVKWNVVFLPFILLPWLLLIRNNEKFKKWYRLEKLTFLFVFLLIFIFLFLVLVWPRAWADPIARIADVASFYKNIGIGTVNIQPVGFISPIGFNLYPLVLFLTQTPEIILFFGMLGVVWVVRNRGGDLKIGYLLLFWLVVPLIRVILPGVRSYAGIRQIMEALPVMAVLAGIGAGYISAKWKVQSGKWIIAGLVFGLLLIPIVRLHPNENSYFNSLAGGLGGAKEKGLVDWTITYGNIYKQGALWLNKNAPLNSNIAHLSGADFALSPLWLRPDISISPYHFSGFDQKGEYIMSLYNPLDPPVFAKRYPERFLKPVHQVLVDGVSLLSIYKNDAQNLIFPQDKELILNAVTMSPQESKQADYWKVDLGRNLAVTRITILGADPNCIGNFKSDEAIAFIPESKFFQPVDLSQSYVFNEKNVHQLANGDSRVEFSFPAEQAHFIYIYPQNNDSCFAKEHILSVSYLNK